MLSPTRAMIRLRAARECSIDRHSVRSARLKAQVSITCWPWVLMIFTCWPLASTAALPLRTGMVIKEEAVINGTPLSERGDEHHRRQVVVHQAMIAGRGLG